jgi:hypothetical protein
LSENQQQTGEHASEPHPPKRHRYAKLVDPLLASVPTLIGVFVGALASHFAEVQRVDFEREDRFRREQIERVAAIAHGYDSLAHPLGEMIAAVETRQPAICRFMPVAAAAEQKLKASGLLHGRLFSPGAVNPNNTAEYGRELDLIAASPDAGARTAATFLKSMISLYAAMLTNVDAADALFVQKREAFQATLMFETKVYFPDRIRQDVSSTIDSFYEIAKATTVVQAPNTLCKVDARALDRRLVDLNVRATREMIAFAQTLEPELGNETIQR